MEARLAAEAAEAAREEEDRLARLRAEYEAAIPDEIRERVQAAVEKELVGGPMLSFLLVPFCLVVSSHCSSALHASPQAVLCLTLLHSFLWQLQQERVASYISP